MCALARAPGANLASLNTLLDEWFPKVFLRLLPVFSWDLRQARQERT